MENVSESNQLSDLGCDVFEIGLGIRLRSHFPLLSFEVIQDKNIRQSNSVGIQGDLFQYICMLCDDKVFVVFIYGELYMKNQGMLL